MNKTGNGLIRSATTGDIEAVAKIHHEQFREHLLGQLSVQLLALYYSEFLQEAEFLVYQENEFVKAFIVGGPIDSLNRIRRSFLRKYSIRFTIELLLKPRVYPFIFERIIAAFLIFSRKSASSYLVPIMETVVLSIAVSPELQGSGIASKLCTEFEGRLWDKRYYWLYVRNVNIRAIAFYHKIGFINMGTAGKEIIMRKQIH